MSKTLKNFEIFKNTRSSAMWCLKYFIPFLSNLINKLHFVMSIIAKNRTIKAANGLLKSNQKDLNIKHLDLIFSRTKEKFSSSFYQLGSHVCTSPQECVEAWFNKYHRLFWIFNICCLLQKEYSKLNCDIYCSLVNFYCT